ncbi:MAG: hypothetical protein KAG28_07830 [Cocleimonas sp.]|nr:hypothetical protein [Cocleimonas sp.]
MLIKKSDANYNPLHFLAALGAGGLAVTFFMYPNFMLPHEGSAMIHFGQIIQILQQDSLSSILLSLALIAIAFLSLLHFRLLFWNISQYRKFRKTEAFKRLIDSNREISLMVIPLTLAMSVNVSFILGAVFIPELWSVVEYLFPFALLAFASIGIYALKILGSHFTRLFIRGHFKLVENNNFSQMVAIFALSMISVGLAAPGAMSHHLEINAIGMFLSLFFLSLALILLVLKLILGFLSTMQHGIEKKTSVSIWIMIPILTLMGITVIRLTMGLHHGFDEPLSKPSFFVITSMIISLQVIVGLIGFKVMKKIGFIPDHSKGTEANAGSFALICPGVAFFVFGMFFLTFGLVQNGLITLMSPAFFILITPLVLIQLQTLRVFFRLICNTKACGACKITLAAT